MTTTAKPTHDPRTHSLEPFARGARLRRRPLALTIALLSAPLQSIAAPEGGQVTAGSGSISQQGSLTTIDQASSRLAIDWRSFDINTGETVRFQQPSAQAIALNRILDQKPSQILGALQANGQVVLVNPRGILFSQTATVDVGGLIASGLDISVDDFMSGNYRFSAEQGSAGFVINRGLIEAASGVGLIGRSVSNTGTIIAADMVGMAAGDGAVLTFDQDKMIGVKVTQAVLENRLGADAAVNNSGSVKGKQVLMTAATAGDLFSQAVNNDGIVQAAGIDNSGGTIRLVAGGGDVVSTGTLDASARRGDGGSIEVQGDTTWVSGTVKADSEHGKGGDIALLGDRVAVQNGARVSASGATGGGTIKVGGSWQGSEAGVRNAQMTYVSSDSRLAANATKNGDGGTVVVWSDDVTRFYGSIETRGGALGGNGGNVETSGHRYLDMRGHVDTGAVFGRGGNWLLDPADITIQNAGSDQIDDSASPFQPVSGQAVSILDVFVVNDYLENIGNLIINTSNQGTQGSGAGNITVQDSISWTSSNSLSLIANNDILFTSGGINGSAGGLNLDAGRTISVSQFIDVASFSSNSINFVNNNTISAGSGAIAISVGRGGADSSNTLSNLSSSGSIGVTGNSGNDSFSIGSGLSDVAVAGGGGSDTVTYTSGSNTLTVSGSKTFADQNGNSFSAVESVAAGGGSALTASGGSFTVDGSNAVGVADIAFTGIGSAAGGGTGSVTGSSGANTFALAAGSNAFSAGSIDFTGISSVAGNGTGGTVTSSTSKSFTLAGSSNAFSGSGIAFTNIATVNAGSGSDITGSGDYALTGANAVTVDDIAFSGIGSVAGGGTGSVTGSSGANTFALAAGSNAFSAGSINFTGISSVAGNGAGGTVTSSTSKSFTLAGSSNAFSGSGIAFTNIATVNSGAGSGITGSGDYALTGANAVTVDNVAFSGIGSVAGGGTGSVTGSSGANTFALAAGNNAFSAGSINFTGISSVAGNGTGGTVTSTASKSYTLGSSDKELSGSGIAFTNIATVNSGTGSSISGNGDYTLGAANAVTVAGIGFTGIGTVTGSGSSSVTGSSGANTFALAAGNNAFSAGSIDFTGISSVAGNGAGGTVTSSTSKSFTLAGSSNAFSGSGIAFTNIATVNAGSGSDITGSGDYALTGANAVTVDNVAFSGIGSVAGGGTGSVTGSSGANTFALTAGSNAFSAGSIDFTGISSVAGNGAGGTVTSSTSKSFTLAGSSNAFSGSGIAFTNIATVNPGSGSDITGSGGADTFTIDGSNAVTAANIAFTQIASVSGGGGSDQVIAGAGADDFTLTGIAQFTTANMTFNQIAAVDGGGGNNRVIGSTGNDTFTLLGANQVLAGGTAFSGIGTVVGGSGTNSITGTGGSDQFTAPAANQVAVAGMTFTDIASVDAGSGSTGAKLTGSSGADDFSAGAAGAIGYQGIAFSHLNSVDGNGGADRLLGGSAALTLTALGTQQIQWGALVLSGIGTVVGGSTGTNLLNGGSGNDQFTLTGTSGEFVNGGVTYQQWQRIDAGGGSNGVTGSANAEDWTSLGIGQVGVNGLEFASIAQVSGGGGNDRVFGSATGSSFILMGGSSVGVDSIQFTGITGGVIAGAGDDTFSVAAGATGIGTVDAGGGVNTLLGGAGDDIFALTDTSQQIIYRNITFNNFHIIDGLAGNNTVQGTASNNTFQITGSGQLGVNNLQFSHIGNVIGGGGVNTVLGQAGGSSFAISGVNQATVDGIGFSQVQNLIGGAGSDQFSVASGGSISGTLDGGGGSDTLRANGAVNRWVVAGAGNQLNGMSFSGFEQLVDGGSDLGLSSDYQLTLASGQRILFSGGNVVELSYAAPSLFDVAGAGIDVAALNLPGATATLRSTGAIRGLGSSTQVTAARLNAFANGNIDLITQIGNLTAIAQNGSINIKQTGNLQIDEASAGGDITVIGDADLVVTRVSTAGPNAGTATLRTTLGNLYVTDAGYGHVNVTAGSIVLDAFLNIGSFEKPFYLYSAQAPRLTSLQYVNPLLYANTPRPNATGKYVASLTEVIASSGLRSAVQSYGADVVDIDPSIFTALLPFSVDEEAVGLPEDQQPD